MIRKVYFDFIKDKIRKGQWKRIFQWAQQYLLIQASRLIGKPLCGPILGTFFTTYNCNYRCKMCDLPQRGEQLKRKGLQELSTTQLKRLLEGFAGLGVSGIGFTGGEPLLRKDIFELLRYTKELGMITHLNTNGFFLNQKNTARLLEAGVDSLNVSLDGARAQTHDTIRGQHGAFDQVINAVKLINRLRRAKNNPIRIKIVAVISQANIEEVPELIKLAQELEVDCIEFIPEQPFVLPSKSRAVNFDRDFSDKLKQTIDYLLGLRGRAGKVKIENSPRHLRLFVKSFQAQKSPLPCFAGYNSLAVDCFGKIYPCMPWINWGRSVGNIKDGNLKQFWYSDSYTKLRHKVSRCRDCYLNCQAELNLLFTVKKSL